MTQTQTGGHAAKCQSWDSPVLRNKARQRSLGDTVTGPVVPALGPGVGRGPERESWSDPVPRSAPEPEPELCRVHVGRGAGVGAGGAAQHRHRP